MPPLRLVIEGRFWDSLIYMGRLYLFTVDGSILTVKWDEIIEDLPVPKSLRMATRCGFQQSDYLYGAHWNLIFADDEIKRLIQGKFNRLSERELVIPHALLQDFRAGEQDNPMPFPHTDATIYRRSLYTVSAEGVHRATCGGRTKYPLSTRPERLWDCAVQGVSPKYGHLALAAGSAGLFELRLSLAGDPFQRYGPTGTPNGEPVRLVDDHCSSCSWSFYSIYGSSHSSAGFLVDYVRDRDYPERSEAGNGPATFRFEKVLSANEIFERSGYSWGIQDKLCQASDGVVRVVRYVPEEQSPDERLTRLGDIEFPEEFGGVVSGSVALFGTVVECDNGLLALLSTGTTFELPEEPVNWRVFPLSRHYENQLHVIYEDRLEVYSFNEDYFVDQRTKMSGLTYQPAVPASDLRRAG